LEEEFMAGRGRSKINRRIPRSVCLSERSWNTLRELSGVDKSYGETITDCIITTQYVNSILGKEKRFTTNFLRYFGEAKRIDEELTTEGQAVLQEGENK
jgi:hypothetical protein